MYDAQRKETNKLIDIFVSSNALATTEHSSTESLNRSELTNLPNALLKYIHGGRGIVTLENSLNNKHHTYEFRRPNNPDEFPPEIMFVYTLVKDNTWMYVGMYDKQTQMFRLTRYSKFQKKSEIVRGVSFILKKIKSIANDPNNVMKIYHEGVCAICGKKLTTPKSIQFGIGPKCRKVLETRL